jgi:uncharacterized protein YcbX
MLRRRTRGGQVPIQRLYRYPVKGLTGEALAEAWLETGRIAPGDALTFLP